jgi:nucleoside-diphosphate-sugar epimerase
MTSKRIIVTGASGFVGRHVLKPLAARGYDIYAITRSPRRNSNNIRWVEADLLNPYERRVLMDCIKPTHLLHAAWHTEHSSFWHSPHNRAWLLASIDLLEHFIRNGGRRVIGIGSCAEYDWLKAGQLPWREENACQPATPYGEAKYALYTAATLLAKEQKFSFAWARLFFLYGPGEPPTKLVASVIRALHKGEVAQCSSGRHIRDFTYIGDIGEALAALVDSHCTGAVNLSAGRGIAIRELVQQIGALMGKPELVQLGALPDREGEPHSIVADTSKLRQHVSVAFPPLEQRLRETIGWWQENEQAQST